MSRLVLTLENKSYTELHLKNSFGTYSSEKLQKIKVKHMETLSQVRKALESKGPSKTNERLMRQSKRLVDNDCNQQKIDVFVGN